MTTFVERFIGTGEGGEPRAQDRSDEADGMSGGLRAPAPSRPVSASDGGGGGRMLVASYATGLFSGPAIPVANGSQNNRAAIKAMPESNARPAPTVIGTPGLMPSPVTERASARPREDDAEISNTA